MHGLEILEVCTASLLSDSDVVGLSSLKALKHVVEFLGCKPFEMPTSQCLAALMHNQHSDLLQRYLESKRNSFVHLGPFRCLKVDIDAKTYLSHDIDCHDDRQLRYVMTDLATVGPGACHIHGLSGKP